MNNTTNEPTYVAHMRLEHRRLNEMVLKIEAKLPKAAQTEPAAVDVSQLLPLLTALRDELASHFNEEERGGCLEEAACRCPSLGQEVTSVLHEHPALVADLERIIAAIGAPSSAARSREIHQEFEGFAAALRAHEEAEDHILESGFGAAVE